MNIATLVTIESILDETRPADATDYREWGRAAGRLLADHPEQAVDVLIEAMTAKARQRIAREQSRTRDGIARFVADQESGQLSAWSEWSDADKLRQIGLRLVKEGDKKIRLGQLMQQAADCIEAHPGATARDAWMAEGLDVATLDAATEEALA